MLVSFPAMQGVIGQRTYYSCLMKLGAIPKMFTFRDWVEFTPEDREQRVLNRKRIPDIAKYILDNEDGYIFASITASYKCRVNFTPVKEGSMLGTLEMDFEDANFVINDGQHRCAAIAAALKENPALAEEAISVLLFPYESRARVQQMFSDLNRFVVKTSKSLDILYDKRDPMSLVTLEVCEKVPVFIDQVDKDAVSLPVRSPKLFSLASLYDANAELLRGKTIEDASRHEMVNTAVAYWTAVSKALPAWGKVKAGELKALDVRQGTISSHSVVLRAIGGIGEELLKGYPKDWEDKLLDLGTVDWTKSNHDWDNICLVAGSVVSNRQARLATKAYLKKHLGLPLTEPERRCLPKQGGDAPTANEDQEKGDRLQSPDLAQGTQGARDGQNMKECKKASGPGIAVVLRYKGNETLGLFDPETGNVRVVSGPHKGKSGSPGGMALAAMNWCRDTVNGWREWRLVEPLVEKGANGDNISLSPGSPIDAIKRAGIFGFEFQPHDWNGARKGHPKYAADKADEG